MTKFGERLLESLDQAIAWAEGKDVPGMVVHEPKPALDVKAIRKRTGLSQTKFAKRFGFAPGTLRNWEQGIRTPQGPTRALLRIIDREPKLALRAMEDEAA